MIVATVTQHLLERNCPDLQTRGTTKEPTLSPENLLSFIVYQRSQVNITTNIAEKNGVKKLDWYGREHTHFTS